MNKEKNNQFSAYPCEYSYWFSTLTDDDNGKKEILICPIKENRIVLDEAAAKFLRDIIDRQIQE
jgi:hypothetical protein